MADGVPDGGKSPRTAGLDTLSTLFSTDYGPVRALGSSQSPSATATRTEPDLPRLNRVPLVVWSGNDDTRLLLRGLLRLHQGIVAFEASTRPELDLLPVLSTPTVLVADAEAWSPEWEQELLSALRDHPELRPLVILPREGGPLGPEVRAQGATIALVRPFTVRDFLRAVVSAAETGPAPPSAPA